MEFIKMCCENNFFTCGSNEQYERVIAMFEILRRSHYVSRKSVDGIVYMTYICSDFREISFYAIEEAVYKLFADKEII